MELAIAQRPLAAERGPAVGQGRAVSAVPSNQLGASALRWRQYLCAGRQDDQRRDQ